MIVTTEDELFSSDQERPPNNKNNIALTRSRSLPHLSHHDSGLGSYCGVGLVEVSARFERDSNFQFL